jgi:hypothetical protein
MAGLGISAGEKHTKKRVQKKLEVLCKDESSEYKFTSVHSYIKSINKGEACESTAQGHARCINQIIKRQALKRRNQISGRAITPLRGLASVCVTRPQDVAQRCLIENIMDTDASIREKEKLTNCYQSNISRMDYRKYRTTGCGITGSGSIESAHRTVIQKRMKLSGQHWSMAGSKHRLRLRVISMNKQWHKVIDMIKKYATVAA